MKKLSALFIAVVFAFHITNAQAPQGMNYQAVARNSTGSELQNQAIGLRFTIRDGSVTGTIIYRETQTDTTNQFGIFTTVIGGGSVVSGNFSSVAWGAGTKYLQVEVDPGGGTNYTDMGTSQLMSVPYALYAQNTPSLNQSSVNYYADSSVTYISATDSLFKSIPGLFQSITVPDGVTTIFQSTGHVGGQNYTCWGQAVIALYVDGLYIDEAISKVDVVTDDNISSGGGNWQIIYPILLTPGTHTVDLKVKGHFQNQCSLYIDDRGVGFSGHSIINVTVLKN